MPAPLKEPTVSGSKVIKLHNMLEMFRVWLDDNGYKHHVNKQFDGYRLDKGSFNLISVINEELWIDILNTEVCVGVYDDNICFSAVVDDTFISESTFEIGLCDPGCFPKIKRFLDGLN